MVAHQSSTKSANRHIVFLAANASYAHSSLAGWYLQEIAAAAGWNWTEVELSPKEDVRPALERVRAINPRILAATFYLFNRHAVLSFIRRHKEAHPQCIVVGGGPEFLGDNREFLLSERAVDLVVRGEGEMAFGTLLERIDDPAAWPAIKGACGMRNRERGARNAQYRPKNGEYFDGGFAEELADLDMIPSPYERHIGSLRKPFVQLETSRGCSNKCSFCTSGGSGGVRYFSLGRVRRDLETISHMKIQGVRLVDRTFNEQPRRAAALIRMFRDDFSALRFHLEIDPARVTRSLLVELGKAGPDRFHIEVGIQSLMPAVYRKIGRQATVKRSLSGLTALCRLGNMDIHADLIAGLPGADLASLLVDVRTLVQVRPAEIQLELLKLLPGTELSRRRAEFGITALADAPYEVRQTPQMTGEDLATAGDLSKLLDRYYNAESLQEAVWTANREDAEFWPRLLEFNRKDGGLGICPSLEDRFRILDELFADRVSSVSRQRLRYAWMKWGFSARRGICAATPWRGPIPETAVLVEGDAKAKLNRKYLVELDLSYIFGYGNVGGRRDATAIFQLAPS